MRTQCPLAAMRAGADVIYQACWSRRSGTASAFLSRARCSVHARLVELRAWTPAGFPYSKPKWLVLQALLLARHRFVYQQLNRPGCVFLGTGGANHFQCSDFSTPYYRAVRRRFLAAIYRGQATYPYPVSHCGFCECSDRLRATVGGQRSSQPGGEHPPRAGAAVYGHSAQFSAHSSPPSIPGPWMESAVSRTGAAAAGRASGRSPADEAPLRPAAGGRAHRLSTPSRSVSGRHLLRHGRRSVFRAGTLAKISCFGAMT